MTAWARRHATALLRVGLGLVAASSLIALGPAEAQSSTLGGYQGVAQADGVHALYNPAGLLPVAAPLDFGAPDAYVTIASGPATYARASTAYPGDLLANPDALLAAGGGGYKAGTVPAWPYKAVASSGTVAHDESSPAPGLDARADAGKTGSAAVATMPALDTPAFATVGSVSTTSETTTDGTTVTVHARSEVSNLDVLGLLKVGSVVTDLTATSDGTAVTLSGGTVVSDASLAGTPVEIDSGGVTAAPGTTTTTNPISGVLGSVAGPLAGNLNDVLGNAGMHVTVAGPVQTGNQKAGSLTAGGLRIDLELSDRTYPALKTLIAAIPPIPAPVPGAPGPGDLIALAKARHLVAIGAGRGAVSLTATEAIPFKPAAPAASGTSGATGSTGVAGTGATATSGGSALRPGTAIAPSLASAAPSAPEVAGSVPAVSVGEGIGALALLALIAQPFLGSWLARGSRRLLAAGGAAPCPWEDT